MQSPVQISFHGLDHSDAVEQRVRDKIKKLEQFYDRITSCRVVIEPHHKNTSNAHHKGEPYNVRIDIHVPGDEIIVKRTPKDSHVHEDIGVALRDAFEVAERQLREFARKQRGDTKNHVAS